MVEPVHILVTGASGFVGSAVMNALACQSSYSALGAIRSSPSSSYSWPIVVTGDLESASDWSTTLRGINVVVHTAARVHVMHEGAIDPLAEYRRINVQGTLSLARQAVSAGVRRFIFISSIKVNGEASPLGAPFLASDVPAPEDAYGVSKFEAEKGLLKLAAETGLEVVIIRPPLIYGPGVKANFARMMSWIDRGVPLPFGAIHNRRSLLGLDNLVDLILCCIKHPAARNQVFLASDGDDLSTTQLLRRLGAAMDRPVRLLPVPAIWIEALGTMLGKRALIQRVCGSLQVDISRTRAVLGWVPPLSVDEGFRRAGLHFLRND